MKLTGNYFNSAYTFDGHRVGLFAPISRPDTRRCLTATQMLAKGWLRNAAGFWISGKRPAVAVASCVGAAIALAGYWIAADVLRATEPLRQGFYANRRAA